MAEALHSSEDLWSSYTDLKKILWRTLSENPEEASCIEFESILRKYKQNFFSLLQNQPKSAKSRDDLKKGMTDGIEIKGLGHQILSKELYQETIILSDMYEMNEFVALDLLCTAQIRMSYYPGLPRGLVAVLLYYDGRKSLVTCLRYMVQARSGVKWRLKIKPDVEKFATAYTDQLMEGGLFNRIFELLRTLDLTRELEKLQENLALGGARHRRQVADLFEEIRFILADVVFTWSAQCGLNRGATLALMGYLRQVEIEQEASGKIDNVNLMLLMAFLSAVDLSVLNTREDGEENVQHLPVLADSEYLPIVISEMAAKWKSEGLKSVATFALAVCIAALRLIPNQSQDVMNKEETLIDTAIENDVFQFLHNAILDNETLYKEEVVCWRMHNLITDFIIHMYPKVKELRIKADEIARTVQIYNSEGIEAPSNLPRYFEYLLQIISKFYSKSKQETYTLMFWTDSSRTRSSLFKFVRLAGDMLPQTLFVPYLTALSSLSTNEKAARHCFNFLKQTQSALSWDHFFLSFAQYYNNLRLELPPVGDTVYRKTYLKGVSPQELEGLHSVLLLIRTIADHDEFSRLALCEHPGWAPLTILLGLVGCSVPIPLKADLLLTLASLSRSSENAAQMWDNLETSQILVTVPTTSSFAPRGIQTELDEIESRLEEYPLTKGLLRLLDVLTDSGIPRTLGAGPRPPGFDPYLSFIINSVFLKFNSRQYRNPSEKWNVAALCLKLFEKFLTQYDPQLSDFSQKDFNAPPGYHLMIQLNNKSELLNVILDVIDEGNRLFDAYITFPGQKLAEECTLRCLNIIHSVLSLQYKFFSVLTASNVPLLLTNITKLLLTINRRSGSPDHCINISKYASYHPYLLKHCLVVVKILNHVTSTPLFHNQFISIFLSSEAKNEVKQGFVLCLDSNLDEEDSDLGVKTKLAILKLLQQCLSYPAPNLSHFLLGFDIKKDVSKTEFQYSGVLDFPRSCIHSIISLMEEEVERRDSQLLESAYQTVSLLSSNAKTYGPVLRFLRLDKKFFTNHLIHCQKRLSDNLNQMSWLLKILAVELKICSRSKQISYLRHLTNFLVNLPSVEMEQRDPFNLTVREVIAPHSMSDLTDRNFLVDMIKHFDFKQDSVEAPQWQFFDSRVLAALIEQCVHDGGTLIDLKKLHQNLYDEVRSLQGTAVMGQIQAITQEIPKVLKYALELNKNNEKRLSVTQFADAWRQVVEVIVLYLPREVLSPSEVQLVCICFALNLLKKVTRMDLLADVGMQLSGAVLLLLDALRKCHLHNVKMEAITAGGEVQAMHLKDVLEGLLLWNLAPGVIDERLKINLYAGLVTFLELISLQQMADKSPSYVSRLDSSKVSLEVHLQNFKMATAVLGKFGEKLTESICQDCTGGFDMCRMLALSCFSVLITLSGNVNWIVYMSGRGYLKVIIQSILDSNDDLQKALNGHKHKPVYVYKAKMLFLTRLAGTRIGAELLLEQKLFSCLGNMNVFTYHPEVRKMTFDSFTPKPDEVYLKIWLPTLEICNAILTTLGTENRSAVVQVMYFLFSHLDVVESILRSGYPTMAGLFLKELSLLTFILARTASNDLADVLENPEIVHDQRSYLFRIQRLTLGLLPKFLLSEDVIRELILSNKTQTFQTSERLLHAMQITANLLSYARNVVANNTVDHGGVAAIFQPTLSDPRRKIESKSGNEQSPSLGLIVQLLISTVNHVKKEKFTFDTLERKLKEIPLMDNFELDQFLEESLTFQDLIIKKECVFDLLSERFEKKKQEMEYAHYIIESALYLLWVHLDYYMLKAIPKIKNFGLNTSILASATEATWKVSTDDISNLKHGLVAILNDSFVRQLLEIVQERTDLDKGFVETLLRKIIRLIQFVPVK